MLSQATIHYDIAMATCSASHSSQDAACDTVTSLGEFEGMVQRATPEVWWKTNHKDGRFTLGRSGEYFDQSNH
eukprot:5791034-Amphidinium_carterae.2